MGCSSVNENMPFDPYFLIITQEEQRYLTNALRPPPDILSGHYGLESVPPFPDFDICQVSNIGPFLAQVKVILESRRFSRLFVGDFREAQIEQVEEFVRTVRLRVNALFIGPNFCIEGFDKLIGHSAGLLKVELADCSYHDWTKNQQIAITNAVARSKSIQECSYRWKANFDESLYLNLLQVPNLQLLTLYVMDDATINLLLDRMKTNTSIDVLGIFYRGWSRNSLRKVGNMLAVNKVLRGLDIVSLIDYVDDRHFLAMHPA